MTDANGIQLGIYRAYPYDEYAVSEGETVTLCAALSKYSATDQLRGGEYYGENKAPVITLPGFLDASVGVDYDVAVTVTDDYGIKSVTVAYTIGGVTETIEMEFNTTSLKYKATIPGSAILAGNDSMTLVFTATDIYNVEATENAVISIIDNPQIVEVAPAANSATHEDKTPEISVIFANAGENPSAVITVDGVEGTTSVEGEKAIFDYEGELSDGKYTATVVMTRQHNHSVTYSWNFTVGEPTYSFYFGQLHSHTAEYSDGTGTLEDVYNYVMSLPDSENIDFVAITDHSNYFDSKTSLGDFEDVESGIIASNGHSKWYNYTTTIDSFKERQDKVIFIGGYEMTWSGQYGHMNTCNSVGIVSRQNSSYTVQGGPGLVAYFDLIKE